MDGGGGGSSLWSSLNGITSKKLYNNNEVIGGDSLLSARTHPVDVCCVSEAFHDKLTSASLKNHHHHRGGLTVLRGAKWVKVQQLNDKQKQFSIRGRKMTQLLKG